MLGENRKKKLYAALKGSAMSHKRRKIDSKTDLKTIHGSQSDLLLSIFCIWIVFGFFELLKIEKFSKQKNQFHRSNFFAVSGYVKSAADSLLLLWDLSKLAKIW